MNAGESLAERVRDARTLWRLSREHAEHVEAGYAAHALTLDEVLAAAEAERAAWLELLELHQQTEQARAAFGYG